MEIFAAARKVADIPSDHLVYSSMPRQIGRLCKPLVAIRAFERLFARVIPFVHRQDRQGRKSLAAVGKVASIWFVAGVRTFVLLLTLVVDKAPTAVVTFEGFV